MKEKGLRTVQILGAAPNLELLPPLCPGVERWGANSPRPVRKRAPRGTLETCTRWFNLHSRAHMDATYPSGVAWYKTLDIPIYTQRIQPDFKDSRVFPRKEIEKYFNSTYFTFSGAWLVAFAIMEGFKRIELYGFELKRDHQYDFERPCMSYWVAEARRRGIDIYVPPGVEFGEPGDPASYTGPLYGYETKPEL